MEVPEIAVDKALLEVQVELVRARAKAKEAYYRGMAQARTEFEKFVATVDDYPNGNKVADALFKAGKCLEALGQSQQARQTFQEVLDRFPQSAAAAGARERLASGS